MLFTKKERIEVLKKLDEIVRSSDMVEEDFEYWLMNGIPDEASEEDYEYIASDISLYNDILTQFAIVMKDIELKEGEENEIK